MRHNPYVSKHVDAHHFSINISDCKIAFPERRNNGIVRNSRITAASGIAASRVHPGFFYVHNDHGGIKDVFVINEHGHTSATITLQHVKSKDVEDIAVGHCGTKGPGTCIYLGIETKSRVNTITKTIRGVNTRIVFLNINFTITKTIRGVNTRIVFLNINFSIIKTIRGVNFGKMRNKRNIK